MKVSVNSSDCIKNSEKNFIGELYKGFDWRLIKKIFKQRYHLDMLKVMGTRKGDIVVVNDKVAYKLDFKATVPLSIVFDRKGNHLALTPTGKKQTDSEKQAIPHNFSDNTTAESQTGKEEITAYDLLPSENSRAADVVDPDIDPKKNISRMANKIALMISEINGK